MLSKDYATLWVRVPNGHTHCGSNYLSLSCDLSKCHVMLRVVILHGNSPCCTVFGHSHGSGDSDFNLPRDLARLFDSRVK